MYLILVSFHFLCEPRLPVSQIRKRSLVSTILLPLSPLKFAIPLLLKHNSSYRHQASLQCDDCQQYNVNCCRQPHTYIRHKIQTGIYNFIQPFSPPSLTSSTPSHFSQCKCNQSSTFCQFRTLSVEFYFFLSKFMYSGI